MVTAKPKKIWDNYEVIGEVRKSDGIKFVVAAATRNGFRYINIREFYSRKCDNVWRPARDGITLPVLMPINKGEGMLEPLKAMLNLLPSAGEVAATMELADEAKAVWYTPKEK